MPLDRPENHNGVAEHDGEVYELTESGQLSAIHAKTPYAPYKDGSSIDWLEAEAVERERKHALAAQPGAKGLLYPLADSVRSWFVVIVTGVGIGLIGAWLDMLVKW
jgi:chloride channel 3/4/5